MPVTRAPSLFRLGGHAKNQEKGNVMNAPVANPHPIAIPAEFQSCFDAQRAAYLAAPEPSYHERIADLKALARLLKDNKDELVAAINADYGNRSEFETLFAEYFVVLETIADATKNLKKWMKPQRRHVDFMTYPLARNRVIPAAARRRRGHRPLEFPAQSELLSARSNFGRR
jgi:coniferyl-aldehyde dehydrogenase